ncbi:MULTISPECIES: hypothetical protein [unclassified Mesorhizobium]|uniref:hypothetical protein n=1 Tax=unclassified Mesorhizobium TaxID=325217 RepID=UPI0033399831
MRFFAPRNFRTAALATLLLVPFAGAYAGPRETALINQIQSVETGIQGAIQANKLEPGEARDLRTQVAQLDRAAEWAAREGTMPSTQDQQLLAQLDDVSQKVRADTGSAFLIGNGADGGYYPNGYGPTYPGG